MAKPAPRKTTRLTRFELEAICEALTLRLAEGIGTGLHEREVYESAQEKMDARLAAMK